MKIISTNIAKPRTFTWQGKEVTTGIYKTPTDVPIYLDKEDVKGDIVADRRVHGGEFKACYLFSLNQYPYWRQLYPNLDWTYGMLGENLTVEDLDEKSICVGDIFKIGEAIVQITIPREPCFKFAHKFKSDDVIQQFIDRGHSGTYVRVLQEGEVKVGDTFQLIEKSKEGISIFDFFELLFAKDKNMSHINVLLQSENVPERHKKRLRFFSR
ncbi:MAG: MOSC domain-containing protein [Bacteroidota bacterium]